MDNIPQWALERACHLLNEARRQMGYAMDGPDVMWTVTSYRHEAVVTLARYIAEHEQEPVDPLIEVIAEAWEWRNVHPNQQMVDELRKSLAKRGLKIVPSDA